MRGIGVGPFFISGRCLVYSSCPLADAGRQAEMLGSRVSHEQLFDAYGKRADYIDVPRGRVVWDVLKNEAVIYINIELDTPENIERIAQAFGFENAGYRIEYDEHYQFASRADSAAHAGQNPVHHAV